MKQIPFSCSRLGFQRAKKSGRRFAAMAPLLLALGALPAFGSTITVTNANDSGAGSLRAALASAANGDIINFNLAQYPATIVLSSTLVPPHGVSIRGPGAGNLAISGGDGVLVLLINAGLQVDMEDLTIEHGSSVEGAAIFNAGQLGMLNVTVANNTVGTQLGAAIFNSGTLVLDQCTVSGNSAGSSIYVTEIGGGIYNYQGLLRILRSDISSNDADLGGGIAVHSGTVYVDYSTISGNTAVYGAGIYVEDGSVTVTRSTFSGNSANDGAGIEVIGGTLTLTNSTIAQNSGYTGVGVDALSVNPQTGQASTGTILISNSTIADNSSGLAIQSPMASATVKGSIFQANSGQNCALPEGQGTIVSEGSNLSSDVSCNSFFTQTGDVNHADTGLDPRGLQDYGGPTLTFALLETSRALDAIPAGACTDVTGNLLITDQRGVNRPQGSACDIGAFEYFYSPHLVQAVETYQIIGAVHALALFPGTDASLTVSLQGAIDSMNVGALSSARGQLGAFVNKTNALVRSGRLAATSASPLIEAAEDVVASLNGQ